MLVLKNLLFALKSPELEDLVPHPVLSPVAAYCTFGRVKAAGRQVLGCESEYACRVKRQYIYTFVLFIKIAYMTALTHGGLAG